MGRAEPAPESKVLGESPGYPSRIVDAVDGNVDKSFTSLKVDQLPLYKLQQLCPSPTAVGGSEEDTTQERLCQLQSLSKSWLL